MQRQVIKKLFSTTRSGNLYTWGKQTGNLGYPVSKTDTEIKQPQILKEFPHNVIKADTGFYHNMVITNTNELYTFGSGTKGQLGHNDNENYIEPKLVNYFSKNGLKVIDAKCGQEFSMALTDDGDVWTWGFGGRDWNFLMKLFANSIGPLGHGDIKHRHTPTPVEELRKYDPVVDISCGYKFCNSLNQKGQLYNWGVGEYGVFGHGDNKSHSLPFLNDYFQHWEQEEGMKIVKMKSANQYTMALMSDGHMYGWGCNEFGQIGIKNEIGVEIYETANYPIQVHSEDFPENYKVQDFAVGENVMAILLDNNEVYWAGKRIHYKPERIILPETIGKIKCIGAIHHCIVIVDENNKIYFTGDFMEAQETNDRTGVSWCDNESLGGGDIISIGGTYQNRYAIVDNSSK